MALLVSRDSPLKNRSSAAGAKAVERIMMGGKWISTLQPQLPMWNTLIHRWKHVILYFSLNLPAGFCSVGHTALHGPWDPGRLRQPSEQRISDVHRRLLSGTAPVGDLDALLWFERWYPMQTCTDGQVVGSRQGSPSTVGFPVSVDRQCHSTAPAAVWVWAGSQCVHGEPHLARVSHGHETFYTTTLGSAVTGTPTSMIDVVIVLFNSFITCRGLRWRESWQIVGTLTQMLVWLLSVLQTDWSLSSLAIMYL